VPLNSCYVAPTGDATTAWRLAAWLNTTWLRAVGTDGRAAGRRWLRSLQRHRRRRAAIADGGAHRFTGSIDWPVTAARARRFRTNSMTSPPSISARAQGPDAASPGCCGARRASWLSRSPGRRPAGDRAPPGPWSPPDQVAGRGGSGLGFEAAPDPAPPGCVRRRSPASAGSSRRLRSHGGALLADPVGSGKTFVALAVARALATRRPTACLVPAALIDQWRARRRPRVPIVVGSHEAASRGRLPDQARGLVLIDEAHRFRHPHTSATAGWRHGWWAGRSC
jgi:hypothetical protein